MMDAISRKVRMQLQFGKYTGWAEQLSTESLESLLLAVGVLGEQFKSAKSSIGKDPIATFAAHNMAEDRMRRAIEVIAAVQAGEDASEEPQAGSGHFGNPGPAFAEHFRAHLTAADALVHWAANLNERQLWTLLWQIGEYGVRVNSSKGPNHEEYPPPSFDVAAPIAHLMRNALRVIAALEEGASMDVHTAKKQIFGETI